MVKMLKLLRAQMIKVIVGLGNPGKKYINTRHNAGFILLDKLANDNDLVWKFEKKFNSETTKFGNIFLVKPQTFMNRVGPSASAIIGYYGIHSNELLVVHDDVDLERESYKLVNNRGSAGHKGVKDIIAKLGTQDFWRLRIGIGRPEQASFEIDDYVLGSLDTSEISFMESIDIVKDL